MLINIITLQIRVRARAYENVVSSFNVSTIEQRMCRHTIILIRIADTMMRRLPENHVYIEILLLTL